MKLITAERYCYNSNKIFDKFLLFSFMLTSIFLPTAFNFLKYFVIFQALIIVCKSYPKKLLDLKNFFFPSFFLLIFIYGLLVAIFKENYIYYVYQDSIGFLFYGILPFFILFLNYGRLEEKYIIYLSFITKIIAIASILLYICFYFYWGSLTQNNLINFNLIFKELGLTMEFGASNSLLRVNSKIGHFLLIGLSIYITSLLVKHTQLLNLFWSLVFFIAIFFDGHRTLVICSFFALVFIFIVLNLKKKLFLLGILVVSLILFIVFFGANTLNVRFGFFQSGSTSKRMDQIPPLINKIAKSPFLGSGFGSQASMIRSTARPFMYEIDFLAVFMKLGVIVGSFYFLLYLTAIFSSASIGENRCTMFIFFTGISYFIFSLSNGGFAMSPITGIFHMHFFTLLHILKKRPFLVNLF